MPTVIEGEPPPLPDTDAASNPWAGTRALVEFYLLSWVLGGILFTTIMQGIVAGLIAYLTGISCLRSAQMVMDWFWGDGSAGAVAGREPHTGSGSSRGQA